CKDDNFLAVDLIDILHQINSLVEESEWEISEVECLGKDADKLHQLSDTNERVSGHILLPVAANLAQVIDGVFAGYRKGESQPWIIIEAVDSSAYDVYTSDEVVLAQLRQAFKQVIDLPQENYELLLQ
ncbi:MAG: hypothetical protein ACRDEA_15565, partial [Microcystaceae cyanobacterium]